MLSQFDFHILSIFVIHKTPLNERKIQSYDTIILQVDGFTGSRVDRLIFTTARGKVVEFGKYNLYCQNIHAQTVTDCTLVI